MSRRAYFYFILVFVLGVVVGSAGTVFYGWYSGRWHHRFDEKRVVHFLRHQLKLSDAQTQQVEQIIQQTEVKFHDLQQQVEPQFEAVRNESRDRIRKVLNPQQLTKFNQLVERFDARRKRHRQR